MSGQERQECLPPENGNAPALQRIMGVYPQRQQGLYMQRVRILGGRLTWNQWRKVAQLASAYTPGTPLHITTRQDIELHNCKASSIPIIQKELAEVGLSTYGACGDTVRNITVCSGCSYSRNGGGVFAVAQVIERHLKSKPELSNLPRKFKISLSGCLMACARPWLSDIGFVRQGDGRFAAIGAGSLGPRPGLGINLYRNLAATDVLPLLTAALELFEKEGDRENRGRARFRHVRERLGDQAFRAELDRRFSRSRGRDDWPQIEPGREDMNLRLLWRLQPPDGNISAAQAIELADIAEPCGAQVRVNLEHGLELYGRRAFRLPAGFADLTDKPVIIACPGVPTCSRGLTDTRAAAERIRAALSGQAYRAVRVFISGCPNSCACSAVAQIGLVGMLRKENSEAVQHYRLFTDGGEGTDNRPAKKVATVRAEDVGVAIRDLADAGGMFQRPGTGENPP